MEWPVFKGGYRRVVGTSKQWVWHCYSPEGAEVLERGKPPKGISGAGWSSSKRWAFNLEQMVQQEIKLTEWRFCIFFFLHQGSSSTPKEWTKVVMREPEHRNKEKKKTSKHVFRWLQGPLLAPGAGCRPTFRSTQRLHEKNMSKQRKCHKTSTRQASSL